MKNSEENPELKKNNKLQKELETESFELNLPDVEDIPAQENIHPLVQNKIEVETSSSDDEEGHGIFGNEENSLLPEENEDSDLTPIQIAALDQTGSEEAKDIEGAAVDEVDADGDSLNEKNQENDLDVPGAELDDEDENIGDEDEENNYYS